MTTEKYLNEIRRIDWTGPDSHHPHIIRNFKIWETHYGMRPHCPNMLIENIRIGIGMTADIGTAANFTAQRFGFALTGSTQMSIGLSSA